MGLGGEALWLATALSGMLSPMRKPRQQASLSTHFTNETLRVDLTSDPLAPGVGVLLGKFPTASPFSFRYAAKTGVLAYEGGDLNKVPESDETLHDRRHAALVCDDTYERHRDT